MTTRLSWIALTCLAGAIFAGVSAQAKDLKLTTTDTMIPTGDAGIQLFMRNKHPVGQTKFSADKILLYVHGATYPSETAFDLPIEGKSMMDLIAARGYDVYLVDVRGYGRSSRPPEMSQPPAANKADRPDPCRRKGFRHSGGLHPQETRRLEDQCDGLVMGHLDRRPLHQREQRQGQPPRALRAAVDSHRAAGREPATARCLSSGLEGFRQGTLAQGRAGRQEGRPHSARRVRCLADATWATDPDAKTKNPGMLRAPNGVVEDTQLYWGAGKALYDPGKITVPTFILHAEWDADLPSYLAQGYFTQLRNAPYRRMVELSEGTHTVMMEKNRMQFFRELMGFLSEEKPLALND